MKPHIFTVPDGYRKLLWEDAKEGQKVFIIGTRGMGEFPFAYGPHTVVSAELRQLKNLEGRVFLQFGECLCVEEE